MKEEKVYRSGIFIYPGVEILDVAGPAEVFAANPEFNVISVGLTRDPLRAKDSLMLVPDSSLEDCPNLDVLVVPGGNIDEVQNNEEVIRWLKAMSIKANIILSVCKGAFLLAAAGLLDGKTFTSHHEHVDKLQRLVPSGKAVKNKRFADSGNIISTAGRAAGIDGALHVVKRIKGESAASATASYLEYPFWGDSLHRFNREPLLRNTENSDLRSNK